MRQTHKLGKHEKQAQIRYCLSVLQLDVPSGQKPSKDDITKKYKELINQTHPDKLDASSEDLHKFSILISQAKDLLFKHYGYQWF